MIDNNKVKASHTRRAAIVYIRQSQPSQVENNRESTARQYALAEKAIALGWDRSQVITIDEDPHCRNSSVGSAGGATTNPRHRSLGTTIAKATRITEEEGHDR